MPEKYSKRIEEAVRVCRRKDTEADHTLIVFCGHGGPTRAAGLSHEVIVELCKDLDILAYDACMVGQIETVQLYALGGFEGYMVANLEYIGWRGFPYHFILQRLLAECPDLEELAIIMVEEFSNYLNQLPYMCDVQTSQAVINVQEVGGVVESFEALVGLLTEGMKDYRPQIRNARSLASQAWGNNIYIDLQIFVEEIRKRIKVDEIKTACDDLIEDIEEMIVAVGTTIKTEGKILSVGIYFPSGHNQVSQSRLDMYEDVGLGCWWISWKPTTQPEGIYNPGAVLQPG